MQQTIRHSLGTLLASGLLMLVMVGLPRNALAAPSTGGKEPSFAVLPFIGKGPEAQRLARRMRFAVAKKISRNGHVKRISDHSVNMMISALQLSWSEPFDKSQVPQVVKALGVDEAIMGYVHGRKLTLVLYKGPRITKTCSAVVPGSDTSPRLTVESLLTRLDHVKFHHVSSQQADLANPVLAERFKKRPNLVSDGRFTAAAHTPSHIAKMWEGFLAARVFHPKLLSAAAARRLPNNAIAIVPAAVAVPHGPTGYCLMMHVGPGIAANNGLAVESYWIPVHNGWHYRFSCWYHSTAPRVRIFLKGFSYQPDQFSNSKSLASQRFERYRAELLPVMGNQGWSREVMDFTPSTEGKKHKIQWMRIDFFIYLQPGEVFFRHVQLKNIGRTQ